MEVTSAHSVHRVTNLSQYKGENSLHKKTKKKENWSVHRLGALPRAPLAGRATVGEDARGPEPGAMSCLIKESSIGSVGSALARDTSFETACYGYIVSVADGARACRRAAPLRSVSREPR
jgi:hypothetical protein